MSSENPTRGIQDVAPETRRGGDAGLRARRGIVLHGVADLVAAALYAWIGFVLAPGRRVAWNVALGSVIALLAVAGIGLVLRRKTGRAIAIVADVVLLGFCLTTVALLVASAAYLRGVYGPIGEGLSVVTLASAALVVEACGLLPIIQLKFLFSDGARSEFERSRA